MEIIELASGERKSVIITETQKSDLKNLTEEKFFFNWLALEGGSMLQLKFRLEEYIDNREFDDKLTFGYFLKEYLQLIHKKRNEFAAEIDIHETLLSQLINNHRAPSESVIIRLELHSNNAIPATYWYRLVEKQKEHFIGTNKELRKMEKRFVKNPLRISI